MNQEKNILMKCVRIMNYLYHKKIPVLPGLLMRFIRVVFSSDVPAGVRIGNGSIFMHNGLGVVIHEKAVIGDNCILMQHVTLGGRNGRGAPTIKNNVFVGAGACILGDIVIGNNVKIGANAVVINDIPDNCLAVGVPAKIKNISHNV